MSKVCAAEVLGKLVIKLPGHAAAIAGGVESLLRDRSNKVRRRRPAAAPLPAASRPCDASAPTRTHPSLPCPFLRPQVREAAHESVRELGISHLQLAVDLTDRLAKDGVNKYTVDKAEDKALFGGM